MTIKSVINKTLFKMFEYSLNSASKEQGLNKIKIELEQIIPDLSEQYTSINVEGGYIMNKLRSQHAFQVMLAQEAISLLSDSKRGNPTIVDIGDSSGTHLSYLNSIGGGNIRAISVNLDPVAVEKIKKKGFEAIESRAELLHEHRDFEGSADIFLSYEMVEHLLDPVSFLHAMATKSRCGYFVVTIPYLNRSRIGLHYIRQIDKGTVLDREVNAETTHIFELSPDDWDLIFRFSGWKIVKSVRYTQYPKNKLNLLSLMRYVWRKLDFDGFYGVILEKDDSISKRYQDW